MTSETIADPETVRQRAKPLLLLVDDEPDFTTLLRTKLAEQGFECEVLNQAANAFEVVKETKPDLLILDVMMPDLSGFEVCRRVKRDPDTYLTPIVLLTAMKDVPETVHGLAQGADSYIAKPFDFADLTRQVKGLLQEYQKGLEQNPATNMPGQKHLQLEVTRKLRRLEPFALSYFELQNFRGFLTHYGPQKRDIALKKFADLLRQTAENQGIQDTFFSHLGGGNFATLSSLETFQTFCSALQSDFERWTQRLYEDLGGIAAYKHAQESLSTSAPFLLQLRISVVTSERQQFSDFKEVMEQVGRVRQGMGKECQESILVDRRR